MKKIKVKYEDRDKIKAIYTQKNEEIEQKRLEKLVYLIAEIIVNASFREHEKTSNPVSKV